MKPIIIVDNFLSTPSLIREHAMGLEFTTQNYQGHSYRGIGVSPLREEMTVPLSRLMGGLIDPVLHFYRRDNGSEPTTAHIHADTAVPASWAGLLYLNEEVHGGTAFWQHKQTGLDQHGPGVTQRLSERLRDDANDMDQWEMHNLVSMRYNRFVAYPTSVFHSRHPVEWVGSEPRLVWVIFFNVQ